MNFLVNDLVCLVGARTQEVFTITKERLRAIEAVS